MANWQFRGIRVTTWQLENDKILKMNNFFATIFCQISCEDILDKFINNEINNVNIFLLVYRIERVK